MRRVRVAIRKPALANRIGRMFASIKYRPINVSRLAIAESSDNPAVTRWRLSSAEADTYPFAA